MHGAVTPLTQYVLMARWLLRPATTLPYLGPLEATALTNFTQKTVKLTHLFKELRLRVVGKQKEVCVRLGV